MSKLHYYIEQADNGMIITDRTDLKANEPSQYCEVAHEKDAAYQLGKLIYAELYHEMDNDLKNGADLFITITTRKSKL